MNTKLNDYLDYLVEFMQLTVQQANAKGVIVGISGGIDSAVVACLAKKAFPDNYMTVWMPIASSNEDFTCAQTLITNQQLKSVTVDLKSTFDTLSQSMEQTKISTNQLAMANTKARLRMTTLYGLGQSLGYLVVGTDNLDEWHIGYFTKFGDGGVDMAPLVHLLKGEVRQAAKILGIPDSIINRAPTAGLWENQTDENEIGFSYDEIDTYLIDQEASIELKTRIDYLHKISEHKRNGAIQPIPFKRHK